MSKSQPHPGHEKHLCKMVEEKVPIEKVKPLVKTQNTYAKAATEPPPKQKTYGPQKNSKYAIYPFSFFTTKYELSIKKLIIKK